MDTPSLRVNTITSEQSAVTLLRNGNVRWSMREDGTIEMLSSSQDLTRVMAKSLEALGIYFTSVINRGTESHFTFEDPMDIKKLNDLGLIKASEQRDANQSPASQGR